MSNKPRNIGIIAFPVDKPGNLADDTRASHVPFSHLVDILHSMYRSLYVITGNRQRVEFKKDRLTRIIEVRHRGGLLSYIMTQLRISWKVSTTRRVSGWIFFIGAEAMFLPALASRLVRRPVILVLTGFPAGISREERSTGYQIVEFMSKWVLRLASRIIVYSPKIVAERRLERYQKKIALAREHFLDFERFRIMKPIDRRENLVAYIGRLSEGKGIPNLLTAIQSLAERRGDIHFLIGGDGPLRERVQEYAGKPQMKGRLEYAGWIRHEELPEYLNRVKLLVLPSYTEALPNIILEAMACGTPVLTTKVGAIPDVIENGQTGFLMADNTTEPLTAGIIQAIDSPDLEKIAEKARNLVTSEYTLQNAVEQFRKALAGISPDQA